MSEKTSVGTLNSYEIMVILDRESSSAKEKVFLKGFEDIVSQLGGSVLKEEFWGEKKFAYPIKKKDRGVYDVIWFEVSPKDIKSVHNKLKLDKSVVRYLISSELKSQSSKLHVKT